MPKKNLNFTHEFCMRTEFLSKRFKRIPKAMSERILTISDSVVLESLMESAMKCESLKEFEKALQ